LPAPALRTVGGEATTEEDTTEEDAFEEATTEEATLDPLAESDLAELAQRGRFIVEKKFMNLIVKNLIKNYA
jgi:hypothetical protein